MRKVLVPFQTPRTAGNARFTMRDMAVGEGALWVLGDAADRRVFKVDLRTGRMLHITSLRFVSALDRGRRGRNLGDGVDR